MRAMPAPKVSVVIPTINEEASIGRVLEEVHAALSVWDHEVVIVDTNSQDRTREIAAATGARVVEEPRRGYGRAYKAGFAATTGDILATLDADLTYPASRIPEMVELVAAGRADFVSGDRLSGLREGAMTGMHRVGNAILNATFLLLFLRRVKDSQSGMWVFRRRILEDVVIHSNGMAFSEELKLEAMRRGYKFVEVPIEYRVRVGDKKIRSVQDATWNEFWLIRKRFGWTRPQA